MRNALQALSIALAIAAAVFLLYWPVYTGYGDTDTHRATLVEVNGPWALVPVGFPIMITLLPFVFPNRPVRIACSAILGVFVFLGGMSIGLFYLPAAVLMIASSCVPSGGKKRPSG